MAANSFALEYEPTWRRADNYPLPNLKISTAAVKDYSKLRGSGKTPTDLPDAEKMSDAFYNYMKTSFQKRYPKKEVIRPYNLRGATATTKDYRGSQLYHSNVIYFNGHGNQQTLSFSDERMLIGEKAYGGDIKWVFIDACNVLNVNKAGQLNKGPAETYWDRTYEEREDLGGGRVRITTYPGRYDLLKDAFIGVHAILGYYSFSPSVPGVEAKYKYFAQYFIEEDMQVWEAYKKAHKRYYEDVKDVEYLDATDGSKVKLAYEPAIAYIKGTDQYGRLHDGSTEKISSTYEVAMDPRNLKKYPKLKYEVKLLSQKYGVPKYN